MQYKCPTCGMTINREDLVKKKEDKTEMIAIRCTKSTKEKWNHFKNEKEVKTSEDGLLLAIRDSPLNLRTSLKT